VARQLSRSHRVHLSQTGDHNDGVFNPLKPGHIFSTSYIKTYDQTFPGWQVFWVNKTKNKENFVYNPPAHMKWWLPGVNFAHYNREILKIADSWLGNPHESIFEVNIIIVDENNIITNLQNEETLKYFESVDVTPHIVDFAAAYFWDSGLHCLSSDIFRTGESADYWPEREKTGIFPIKEWYRAGEE
jgi:hypothetical protein